MQASSLFRTLSALGGLGISIVSMKGISNRDMADMADLLFERPRPRMTDYLHELRVRDYWMKELNGELDAPTPYWKGRVKHHEKVYEPNPTNSAKPRTPFKKRKP